MRVIVDTNVLISAIFRDRLPERVLFYIASRDDVRWIVTQAIVAEYKRVLSRPKFGIPTER